MHEVNLFKQQRQENETAGPSMECDEQWMQERGAFTASKKTIGRFAASQTFLS